MPRLPPHAIVATCANHVSARQALVRALGGDDRSVALPCRLMSKLAARQMSRSEVIVSFRRLIGAALVAARDRTHVQYVVNQVEVFKQHGSALLQPVADHLASATHQKAQGYARHSERGVFVLCKLTPASHDVALSGGLASYQHQIQAPVPPRASISSAHHQRGRTGHR